MQQTLFGPYFIPPAYRYLKLFIASFHCLAFSDFFSVYILSLADLIDTQVISYHYVVISPKSLTPPERGDVEPNCLSKHH